MARLWDKESGSLDEAILKFTVGDDPVWDLELLPFDCLASAAHMEMLGEVGLIGADDVGALRPALKEAFALAQEKALTISVEQEDGHTALEQFLTERAGEAGKKIHTGRSRNDQVIAATRLWVRHEALAISERLIDVGLKLGEIADRHAATLMPGFTHTRQGMPSSVGQLLGAYAEAFLRDVEAFLPALSQASRGALGSASGYGVPLPLDRSRVSDVLGLDETDVNTIYVQNTRGRLEATYVFALHQASLTVGRLASDLVWFSSEPFGFFGLPRELTTGSSIMPQKRNPDVFELLRTLPATLLARYTEISAQLHGLGAGYHRDLQRTKGPMLDASKVLGAALKILAHTVDKITVDEGACVRSLRPEIFATDHAYAKVRNGQSFREAYLATKDETHQPLSAEQVLEPRKHLGAVGTAQQSHRVEIAQKLRDLLKPFQEGAQTAQKLLAG
jgi:argininosuccinate lyase